MFHPTHPVQILLYSQEFIFLPEFVGSEVQVLEDIPLFTFTRWTVWAEVAFRCTKIFSLLTQLSIFSMVIACQRKCESRTGVLKI